MGMYTFLKTLDRKQIRLTPLPLTAKTATALFIFGFLSQIATAQSIEWTKVSEQYNMPEGVELYQGTRSSPPLKAWYLEVDTKVASIGLVPYLADGGTETITNFSKRSNAIAVINGGYFGGNASYSTLVQPGQVLARNVGSLSRNNTSYPIIRSAFSIGKDRSMSVDWIYHFSSLVDGIYRFPQPLPYTKGSSDSPLSAPKKEDGEAFEMYMGVGGGPILVKGDSVHVTYNEEIFWGSGVGKDNRDPRTAVGYTTDGKAILLVADGRQGTSYGLSLPEMAQVMIDLGCTEAINLDGGGSSQMVVHDALINRPEGTTYQRPVATFLAVVPADSIPSLPVIGFEEIIDTGDAEATVSSGWTSSANSGFWGETPSLITLGGDGSKTVEFRADLPSEGRYRLDGWWVASFNRSKKTAYIVEHRLGIDTVYANQSTNSAQWVELGEYEFTGTSSDRVTISNLGGDSFNYVVADAVRWVGLDEEITSSESEFESIADSYQLINSYPNPFNPSTEIIYQLEHSGRVHLEVYNLQGQRLSTLVEEWQSAGEHSVQWDAQGLSSGLYFVRLAFENSQSYWYASHKVTLVK